MQMHYATEVNSFSVYLHRNMAIQMKEILQLTGKLLE